MKMESLKIPQQRSIERNGSDGTITDPSVVLRKSAEIETKVIKGAKEEKSIKQDRLFLFPPAEHRMADAANGKRSQTRSLCLEL